MDMRQFPRSLSKAFRLPRERKRRAVRCLWHLIVASARLAMVPDHKVTPLLGTAVPTSSLHDTMRATVSDDTIDIGVETGRYVARAARILPWHPTCMRQALAAHRILDHDRVPHVVHLGIRDAETLAAHAWVTVGTRIVLGAAGIEGHVPVAGFVGGEPVAELLTAAP